MRLPNTRVQRTRSSPSALRSPLTRRPLGRFALVAAALTVMAVGATDSSAQDLHVISQLGTNQEPLLPDTLTQRIRDAAEQYKSAAPIPRIALFDVAFPASPKELAQLNQQAVILVTALTQDGTELPLSRVYVLDGRVEIALPRLSEVMSRVHSDQVARTFGTYRQDSMFLLPAYLTLGDHPLFVDFAANRKAFKLGSLGPPPEVPGITWSTKPARGTMASAEALSHLIEREYPGLLAK